MLDDIHILDLPANWRVDIADSPPIAPLSDPQVAVTTALSAPLHAPPLREIVRPGDQVCIAFTPPAAPCPEHILAPAILRELEAAGVDDPDVNLLCASGLHGRTSHDDKVVRLGEDIVERYRVIDHDVGEVVHLGQWQGIPLTINRHALEADLLISTGVVAPHLYAGYSGGAETLAVGCAGDATIEAIHAPRFLYHSLVRPGQVRGNPFQDVIQTLAQRAELRFIVNAILDPSGQIVDVQAGDFFYVHQYLVFAASNLYNKLVAQDYDVVIAGITPAFDSSLYQAVLGPLLVGLAPNSALRPGGVIILPARTPEAIGQESNAQNFFNALQGVRSVESLIPELLERGYRPGEARAFQLARLLEQHQVIVVGSEFPALVRACHMHEAPDMQAAIELTEWLLGSDLDVLIVPHALHTLPVPATFDSWNERVDLSIDHIRPW